MNGSQILFLVILGALTVFLIVMYFKKTKPMVIDHVHLITGGVKSGKTTLAVHAAIKLHRKVHFKWRFCRYFFFWSKKCRNAEEPLLYSNIVLSVPYVPLTDALINRKERFAYKSVILVSESSLVADSFDIKNNNFNDNLKLFNKLIGHETHGGYLIYETQALSDNHFAVKRVLSRFTIITKCIKWVPFVLLFKTCDVMYNADDSVQLNNIFNQDAQDSGRYVFVPKRVWKKFDCYTYSQFTDGLPVAENVIKLPKGSSLKTKYLLHVRSDTKNG